MKHGQYPMNFSYNTAFEGKNPEAYERVLFDAIAGDQTLFSTSAEVLACWEILEPIIQTWRNHNYPNPTQRAAKAQ